MSEPAFTETLQIGIVVRDLETAMRRYVDDFAIGPWEIFEFHAGEAEALHEHGMPVQRSWRLATAMVGSVQWELIEPLDAESDYARFLAEKGGGVHHVAVASSNFDDALAGIAKKGQKPVLSGTFGPRDQGGVSADRAGLGLIVEIFSSDPAPEQQADEN